jgi:hypothetical protein
MKNLIKFLSLVSIFTATNLRAEEGCGNIAIDHFAVEWRVFGAENSETITRQLVTAIRNANKNLANVSEVVTAETFQDRIGLDVLTDSNRSIRGEGLDVMTSTETTEAVIIFADRSTLRTMLEYPRPRNRGFVLGG